MNNDLRLPAYLPEEIEKDQYYYERSFLIEDRKPSVGDKIAYEGNLGFSEGKFKGDCPKMPNVGLVELSSGEVDRFDRWAHL